MNAHQDHAVRRCEWFRADDGHRYLVPGCWNRAVYGDHADCHCQPKPPKVCKCCGQEIRT